MCWVMGLQRSLDTHKQKVKGLHRKIHDNKLQICTSQYEYDKMKEGVMGETCSTHMASKSLYQSKFES